MPLLSSITSFLRRSSGTERTTDRTRKFKGLVLFLTYHQDKAAEVRPELMRVLERCSATNWHLVTINNTQPDAPWTALPGEAIHEFAVGGDNACGEFTGWDKGWQEATAQLGNSFDVVLLVNCALKNSKPVEHLRYVNNTLIRYVAQWPSVVGWVDTFSRVSPEPIDMLTRSMGLFGMPTRRWVCTTFMLFAGSVFKEVAPLAAAPEPATLYFDTYAGDLFRPDCGLSKNYQQFLIDHQTRKWYKKYEISAETYEQFKAKTRMIINEHYLGARIGTTGARLLNFYEMARTSSRKAKRLKQLEPQDYKRYRYLAWKSDQYSLREILKAARLYYLRRFLPSSFRKGSQS